MAPLVLDLWGDRTFWMWKRGESIVHFLVEQEAEKKISNSKGTE